MDHATMADWYDRNDGCFDGDDLGVDECCETCGGPLTDMGAHGIGCEACAEKEMAAVDERHEDCERTGT